MRSRSGFGYLQTARLTAWVALVALNACGEASEGSPGGAGSGAAGGSSAGSAGKATAGTSGSSGGSVAGTSGSANASAGSAGSTSGVGGGGAGGTGSNAGGASGSPSLGGTAGTSAGSGGAGAGAGESGAPAGEGGTAGSVAGASGSVGAGGTAGTSSGPPGDTDLEGLIGFATVAGYGRMTTTGAGDGAPTVTVSNFADFVSAVSDATPRIVQVSGRITGGGSDMVDIGSHKTILGLGDDATIDGFGLDINGWTSREVDEFGTDVCEPESMDQFARVENVVVRNLTFVNTPDDSINVQCYSHHIWVDHNTFNVSNDGSVDVKRGSDLVTISFNRFVGTDKTMLLGHSADNGAQDRGFLRVTYHHNWFDATATRTPRVRFGFAHVFNNYLDSSDYFLGLGVEAKIYAEANYVEQAKTLTQTFTESADYHLTWTASNRYDVATITRANSNGATQSEWLDADGSVTAPSAYTYTAEAAASLPTTVRDGAGAGKLP